MGLPRQWRRVSIWINYALCQRILCTESFKKNEVFWKLLGLLMNCCYGCYAFFVCSLYALCFFWLHAAFVMFGSFLALVFQKERAPR